MEPDRRAAAGAWVRALAAAERDRDREPAGGKAVDRDRAENKKAAGAVRAPVPVRAGVRARVKARRHKYR